MNTLFAYVATLIPLILLDAVWLGLVSKGIYVKYLGFLFAKNLNITPALFFYPIYALAVTVLVVMPAVEAGSLWSALWRGALLGLAAYAAYDLTNQATISGWPLQITLIDMAWGVFASALVSVIAFLLITTTKVG